MKSLILLLTLVPMLLIAQREPCGFKTLLDEVKDDSMTIVGLREFELNVQKEINRSRNKTEAAVTIPVVIHIVWHKPTENISDEIVLSQIDALNRDFNLQNQDSKYVPDEFKPMIGNVGIKFCLAGVDPNGSVTTGIVRTFTSVDKIGISKNLYYDSLGGSSAWNPDRYLNIWVANTGNVVVGIGSYPWFTPKERSGVIVQSSCFGSNGSAKYGLGRVCVHEVGHYLGLLHPWGDVYNCTADDSISDTPLQHGPYFDCPIYPQNGCSQNEMFMNFMDYADDQCELLFTEGQASRMRAVLQVCRQGIVNSNVACQTINHMSDKSLSVYPNPSSDFVTIAFQNHQSEILAYKIFNSIGQLILEAHEFVNNELTIDISSYTEGIYYLSTTNNKIKISKIR